MRSAAPDVLRRRVDEASGLAEPDAGSELALLRTAARCRWVAAAWPVPAAAGFVRLDRGFFGGAALRAEVSAVVTLAVARATALGGRAANFGGAAGPLRCKARLAREVGAFGSAVGSTGLRFLSVIRAM